MTNIVLYNVSHYGYLSEFIVHSLCSYKKHKKILLFDVGWLSDETKQFVESHQDIPGFDLVIKYNERDLDYYSNSIEADIINYFNNILKKNNIEISSISTIITGFDTIHAFGVYLSSIKKQYVIFDDSLLSSINNEVLLKDPTPYKQALYENLALSWKSKYVSSLIYSCGHNPSEHKLILEANNDICKNRDVAEKPTEYFDIYESYKTLTNKDQKSIINYYGLSIPFTKCDILLMTSFFYRKNYEKTKKYWNYQETFLYPYRFLLDFMKMESSNLIIKAHPNTSINQESLTHIFNDVVYMQGYIPSNLLSIYELDIQNAISPGSYSISTIKPRSIKTLPRSFFNYFEDYVKLLVLKEICNDLKTNLEFSNYYPNDLGNGFRQFFTMFPGETKLKITRDRNSTENGTVYFEKPTSLKRIVILQIIKHRLNPYSVYSTENEYIFIRDDKTNSQISSISGRFCMKYCGLLIEYSSIPPFDYISSTNTNTNNEEEELLLGLNSNRLLVYFKEKLKKNEPVDECLLNKMINIIDLYDNTPIFSYFLQICERDQISRGIDACLGTLTKNCKTDEEALRIARIYKNGNNGKKDVKSALEWYDKISDPLKKKCCVEIFDCYWEMNDPQHYDKMIAIVKTPAFSGDGGAMGRLGRAYRDGKGVNKDLEIAAEWFRKASATGLGWTKNSLFDTLWEIGTPEAYSEMIQVATDFAAKGDGGAMGRLGRAYRDGRGVNKNVKKASEWYKKAMDKGIVWAEKELTQLKQ